VALPLSAFPKTFGLNELKKGYFPNYFNTNENQNYVGPIPDTKYYGTNTMSKPARETFLKWHTEKFKENYVFDFQKEFVEYCNPDVDILRRGCLELRKQFLEIADIDPFQYITIASVCMAIYRSKYLQPKTIAVVKDNMKEKSLYAAQNLTGSIRKIILCINSIECFWHGCPKCYHDDTINNINHETMGDA
jgi:hypothetical protein